MDIIAEKLDELNNNIKKLLEIEGLAYATEPLRYIARKLRSGEAIADKGMYYQLIAGGDTFALTSRNPEGYVWIGIMEGMRVSQNGVFEFTRMVDDELLPWLYIPRAAEFDFNWSQVLPFGFVIREVATVIFTNHDGANQWVIGGYIGAYLRKDVWERDSRAMDLAAEKYAHPEII
ncbi:hypothetical protein ES703_88756 [subsurface metagenome]